MYFPASEEMPETNRHLELRTALYLILKRAFAPSATIGSEQFVYWDPTTAKKRLSPDVFVRLGAPHRTFRVWKTWERGAPDLGVEIISDSDASDRDWDEKLARYRAAGVGELVRFDPDDPASPLRIWDLIDGDLLERAEGDPALRACESLGLWWTIVEDADIGPMLRLSRDPEGRDLLPTPDEAARAEAMRARMEADSARIASEQARAEAERARMASEQARIEATGAQERNAELEAEVAALRAKLAGKKAKAKKQKG